ncbi:MAG TPA: hypothetical protein VER96_29940 [Polyangiaceae bacterium]|nr:hypothetical protein [Polyangiaceae bacterium]
MNWVQWLILSTFAATACGGEITRPLKAESPYSSDDGSILASKVPPRDQTAARDALEFTIESIDSPDHNLLRYRLRNVSDEPLWVNARMLNSSSLREVTIRVTPSISELPIQPDCRIHPGPPEYVRLEPQGEISVVRPFSCLEFPNEGPWRVSAEYHDRSRSIPRPRWGALWFNGTVTSNEIQFSAKSTDAAKKAR